MPTCLIGLGANLGDRRQTLSAAIAHLRETPAVEILAESSLYETRPVGGPSGQPLYLNGVVKIKTALSPPAIWDVLSRVETELGRQRGGRWAARTVDLDLLLYGDRVIESPDLVVPHPRMAVRRFVLEPAAEIAGEMVHPTIGWRLSRLLGHLDTSTAYVAIAGPPGVGKTRLATDLANCLSARLITETVENIIQATGPRRPAGQSWQREIELLEERAGRLANDRWPDSGRTTVSDFWFDQSLAFAALTLTDEQMPEFRARWCTAGQGIVSPRLVVFMDAPIAVLTERLARCGHQARQDPIVGRLEELRAQLATIAGRQGIGPVLKLAGHDLRRSLEEVVAAVEAMQ